MNDITFRRNLQSVLYDNKYDRAVGNKRTGKLNGRKLSKIGYSDKVFKKKEERQNKEYTVSIMVDISGSMAGDRIKYAKESADKLSKHFSAVGINHNIIAFGGASVEVKPYSTGYDRNIQSKLHEVYGRTYLYWKRDEKDIRKLVGTTLKKPTDFTGKWDISGDTAFYFPLKRAYLDIQKQKGKKIIIFLTDGKPNNSVYPDCYSLEFPKEMYPKDEQAEFAKLVSLIVKENKVELYGIGIQQDSLNKFFPPKRVFAVYDMPQLYDHMIKIIKLNLKRI